MHYQKEQELAPLRRGKTEILANTFTEKDPTGDGYYVITYWDERDGIIFYDYTYSPSRSHAYDVIAESMLIGIVATLAVAEQARTGRLIPGV